MESKFVIFLVFASLAQSCYGSTLKVSYGLPENEVVTLEKIINNQEASGIAASDAYETLFDTLIGGLGNKTHNHCSKVAKAFAKVKDVVNLFLDSIILLLGDSSSANVGAVRNISCFYLDDISDQMTSALELAKRGNYSENQADIENYQTMVLTDFTNLSKIVWHLIYNDENYQDIDVQAVIESAANKSLTGFRRANNAFFNAIKLTVGTVDAKCGQYKTLESYVEELRGKALAGLRYDVETKYSALEALYINSRLNLTGLVSDLTEIQYAQIVSQARYALGNVVLFNTLKRHVTRILYNLSDDGRVDYSQDDDDLQRVIAFFDVGDHAILDSFLTFHPDAASTISSTRDTIHTMNVAGDVAFYDAIPLAVAVTNANYSKTLEEIETLRHAAVDPAPEYTGIFFNLIRNNKTFDDEIEAKLVGLQNLTTYGAQVSTNKFLDGVLILVDATYIHEVTDETFSAIETLLVEAIDGLQSFTQGIAAASMLVSTEN